jgi:hypothetical protein
MHPLIRYGPDPDHPGWWTWDLPDEDRYNASIGKLLVRGEGEGRPVAGCSPARARAISAMWCMAARS